MPNVQTQYIAREFVKQALKEGAVSKKDLQMLKNKFSVKYKVSHLTSVELVKAYDSLVAEDEILPSSDFETLIRKRGVRSLSGIASVTAMTKHFPCPGRCIFCPTERDMPKSYLSNEPAVMRAILNDFDPYRQTVSRLKGLRKTGHPTDKIEVIISGGTFNFYPKRYQVDFIRGIFNALNFDAGKKSLKARTLSEAQELNEKTLHRCVGLSLETRPDYVTKDELKRFRAYGCTKVEIGVQCLDDGIYKLNKRGHTVEDVKKAFQLLKDAGFKINAHFMPNMYGSNLEKDLEMFKELFENPAYCPDWLKIYPCVVVPGAALATLYKKGIHKVYTDRELIDLLCKFKEIIPEYCRLTRLYRDIPIESIIGGSKLSNLRQFVQDEMKKRGKKCRCIRCREIRGEGYIDKDVKLVTREYESSGGKEYFLSYEDVLHDKLIGFLRLRIPSQHFTGEKHWIRELNGCAIIREIHVFGQQIRLRGDGGEAGQHKGYGKNMILEAIRLTKLHKMAKLAVISGVGVREYYRKLGFKDGGLYQVKNI